MRIIDQRDNCPICHASHAVNQDGRIRAHGPVGIGCRGSLERARPDILAAMGLPAQKEARP